MIDVEQTSKDTAPFQSECNTAHFFAGGGRGEILKDIQNALTDKTELVTLIGAEGSGKTMLCKMLQEQWNTMHKVIFMSSVVESFEDVVRVAAQECKQEYPVDATRADAKKIFLNLVKLLQSKGLSLLLICDEAENMYLATLERIRKILDDVTAQGGGLQVLLAGRKSLKGNLRQLDLCDFAPIVDRQFFLSTLDDNETWSYLNFCVQSYRGTEEKEVFTKEAAAKIASMSKGNLRMINMYADESLQSSSDETSFLVLLDHVKDGEVDNDLIDSGSGLFSQLPFSPKYILGGVLLLAFFVMIFLISGGDEEQIVELKLDQDGGPVFTNPPKQMDKEVEKPVVIKHEKEVELVASNLSTPKPVLEPVTDQEAKIVKEVKVVAKVDSPAPALSEPKIPVRRTPVEISPVGIVERISVEPELPELTKQNKISADKIKRILNPRITISKKKKIPVKVVPPPVKKTLPSKASQDPVLEKFIAVGEKWQAGEADSSFTIQLMSLESDQAEKNLKRIVSQPEYQAVADKLVVLTRPSDPPAIFVFYGVYPSMEAARNARNNIPIFLRDRHPYPVSVRGAVEKVRTE